VPGQGEIEAKRKYYKIDRCGEGNNHRRGRNVPGKREFEKNKFDEGEWQTRVVPVIPETKCQSARKFADVERIHPRTNRKGLGRLAVWYPFIIIIQIEP
jgi:hypothetical protein